MRVLTVLALVQGVGECLSAVVIAVERYADSAPGFAVLFAGLFFLGAWLLRRRRVLAGASLVAALTLVEVATYPSWQRHNSFDWVSQSAYAALSAVTLVLAVVVVAGRIRTRAPRAA